MASTPSASALSAVLRCRGNIFARNKANKKRPPASSGYSLGVKCGAVFESVVPILSKEHGWKFGHTLQEWKSSFLGQCVQIRDGVFLAVTLEARRKNSTVMDPNYRTPVSDNKRREVSQIASQTDQIGSVDFLPASLPQAAQHCHRLRFRSAPGSLQRRLFTSDRKCLGIKENLENGVVVYSKCEKKLLEKHSTWNVLCMSIRYLPKSDRIGEQITEPVVMYWYGWTTLKNGCIMLAVVISEMLRMRLLMENCRLSIPFVLKPDVVEIPKTQSNQHKSMSISLGSKTMGKDGQRDTTDQKVELGDGSLRTSEHQSMEEITKVGELN